jgi:hypothetical protein
MRCLLYLTVFSALTFGVMPAQAVERYTDARITQLDMSDNTIVLFLEVISGEAVPIGNGGSNESNKPFLMLANSAADIESRKHFLAAALMAQTQGSIMRFRWEDAGTNANRIVVLLLRQP